MVKRGLKPSLSALEEKKAALDAQIKELRKAEKAEAAVLERKRHAVLGAALVQELAENEVLAAQLEPLLNARITRPADRKLLGLEPLPKAPLPSQGPESSAEGQ